MLLKVIIPQRIGFAVFSHASLSTVMDQLISSYAEIFTNNQMMIDLQQSITDKHNTGLINEGGKRKVDNRLRLQTYTPTMVMHLKLKEEHPLLEVLYRIGLLIGAEKVNALVNKTKFKLANFQIPQSFRVLDQKHWDNDSSLPFLHELIIPIRSILRMAVASNVRARMEEYFEKLALIEINANITVNNWESHILTALQEVLFIDDFSSEIPSFQMAIDTCLAYYLLKDSDRVNIKARFKPTEWIGSLLNFQVTLKQTATNMMTIFNGDSEKNSVDIVDAVGCNGFSLINIVKVFPKANFDYSTLNHLQDLEMYITKNSSELRIISPDQLCEYFSVEKNSQKEPTLRYIHMTEENDPRDFIYSPDDTDFNSKVALVDTDKLSSGDAGFAVLDLMGLRDLDCESLNLTSFKTKIQAASETSLHQIFITRNIAEGSQPNGYFRSESALNTFIGKKTHLVAQANVDLSVLEVVIDHISKFRLNPFNYKNDSQTSMNSLLLKSNRSTNCFLITQRDAIGLAIVYGQFKITRPYFYKTSHDSNIDVLSIDDGIRDIAMIQSGSITTVSEELVLMNIPRYTGTRHMMNADNLRVGPKTGTCLLANSISMLKPLTLKIINKSDGKTLTHLRLRTLFKCSEEVFVLPLLETARAIRQVIKLRHHYEMGKLLNRDVNEFLNLVNYHMSEVIKDPIIIKLILSLPNFFDLKGEQPGVLADFVMKVLYHYIYYLYKVKINIPISEASVTNVITMLEDLRESEKVEL